MKGAVQTKEQVFFMLWLSIFFSFFAISDNCSKNEYTPATEFDFEPCPWGRQVIGLLDPYYPKRATEMALTHDGYCISSFVSFHQVVAWFRRSFFHPGPGCVNNVRNGKLWVGFLSTWLSNRRQFSNSVLPDEQSVSVNCHQLTDFLNS